MVVYHKHLALFALEKNVFIALGILLCYIMGRNLVWNWLALAAALFLFPFTFGLYFIPESPPWLIYNDEEDLAFKSLILVRGEEYDASTEISNIKDSLCRHKNDLHALLHGDYKRRENGRGFEDEGVGGGDDSALSPSGSEELEGFKCQDVLQPRVFYPFLLILVLMFLLQFSGQGAMTFYTALIFREARLPSALAPNDASVVIGLTYLISSIVGLVLKRHFGRRPLLLASEFFMGTAQVSLGVYFYLLNYNNKQLASDPSSQTTSVDSYSDAQTSSLANNAVMLSYNDSSLLQLSDTQNQSVGAAASQVNYSLSGAGAHGSDGDALVLQDSRLNWLPLPILIIYTAAFNIGMGSLTWVVATEILPVRSRKWAHTMANVTSNFWWFVVTYSFKDFYIYAGPHVPFLVYGVVCLLGFIFIYVFLPETQGRSVEETEDTFSSGLKPILDRVLPCCSNCNTKPPSQALDACLDGVPPETSPTDNPLKRGNSLLNAAAAASAAATSASNGGQTADNSSLNAQQLSCSNDRNRASGTTRENGEPKCGTRSRETGVDNHDPSSSSAAALLLRTQTKSLA